MKKNFKIMDPNISLMRMINLNYWRKVLLKNLLKLPIQRLNISAQTKVDVLAEGSKDVIEQHSLQHSWKNLKDHSTSAITQMYFQEKN
ncbi:hypothetical protein X975_22071, partial [Stegodyphus mimosarum]